MAKPAKKPPIEANVNQRICSDVRSQKNVWMYSVRPWRRPLVRLMKKKPISMNR